MHLIDSHCHLASFAAQSTLTEILHRAAMANVNQCITISTSSKDWPLYAQFAQQHPQRVSYTVGLHPSDIGEDWQDQLASLPAFFTATPAPVAIGEIGLDYFRLPANPTAAAPIVARQKAAFRQQLSLAQQLDCPVVIHSRNAFDDCVAMINAAGIDWQKVVFHCWSENAEAIRRINAYGGRGSFTGIITYKNAEAIRAAALAQGLDKLILETDAPYLAPVPHRGKPNEPAFTADIARYCAELFDVSLEELVRRTMVNTQAFFQGLPPFGVK